ncbi:MAG: hypothetical protein CME62_00410 [Halobacteriovoraceae bacterium]|nr:hypothetical protein [Halobacteriovoraceae bacterium]|tara:strand:- start:3109 stop:4011 length:903 start_codon:yes stop_codon:yes gene_type:complete
MVEFPDSREFNTEDKSFKPPFKKENITPPGVEEFMQQKPKIIHEDYKGSDKLKGKTALITGGDSGIGRAVCIHFAIEGADIVFTHLPEEKEDAEYVCQIIKNFGRKAIAIAADFQNEDDFEKVKTQFNENFKSLDILVNNAAFQNHVKGLNALSIVQFEKTFQINIFAYFKMVKFMEEFMPKGSNIINTSSILGFVGDKNLIDYSATKAAIHNLTKSLSKALAKRKIRVNAVAPGPVWTPLNPAERNYEEVKEFGENTAFNRPAQPAEIAPAYVYLASDITASYITGETINIYGSASGAN